MTQRGLLDSTNVLLWLTQTILSYAVNASEYVIFITPDWKLDDRTSLLRILQSVRLCYGICMQVTIGFHITFMLRSL